MVIDETKLQSLLLDTNILSVDDLSLFEKEQKEFERQLKEFEGEYFLIRSLEEFKLLCKKYY